MKKIIINLAFWLGSAVMAAVLSLLIAVFYIAKLFKKLGGARFPQGQPRAPACPAGCSDGGRDEAGAVTPLSPGQ